MFEDVEEIKRNTAAQLHGISKEMLRPMENLQE